MAEEETESTETHEATPAVSESRSTSTTTSSEQDGKFYTNADLDKLIAEKVNRAKSRYKDYDDLKGQASQATELREKNQKLQEELDSVAHDFSLASRDAVALKVAMEKGIPMEMVHRLQGDTEEELRADADSLAGMVTGFGQRRGFDGGNSGVATGTKDSPDAVIRQLMGY